MIKQIIKFIAAGGSATALDYIIYVILTNYINIGIAKFISISCAIIFAYFINKLWTFKVVRTSNLDTVSKYIISQFINIIVNVSINYTMFKITNDKNISFIIATICAAVINFMLLKFYTFQPEK